MVLNPLDLFANTVKSFKTRLDILLDTVINDIKGRPLYSYFLISYKRRICISFQKIS
jgi:hypothetical protein